MVFVLIFFFSSIAVAAAGTFIYMRRYKGIHRADEEQELRAIENISQVLGAYFPYYKALNADEKIRFEERVIYGMSHKTFELRGSDDVPSAEMRLAVTATLVQLTFGLREWFLPQFHTFVLFPDKFRGAKPSDQMRIGEAVTAGVVALSWKHFVKGFAIADDAHNVGLHELAHALYIENRITFGDYNFLDENALRQIQVLGESAMQEIREGKSPLMRQYAGSNMDEFFAVSVEYFFEQPEKLFQFHPGLYTAFMQLLQQDPRRKADPVLDGGRE